jgi:long-chain fatty acid transport protein
MNLQNKKAMMKTATLLAVIAMSSNLLADGYRNPPPTAEGIAKSGVNSAFVDDASAISYNPANLAMLTNGSFVASLTLARTANEYSPVFAPGATFDSDGDWNFLPNFYYAAPVSEAVVFGLGITSPYGQGIEWEASDFLPYLGLLDPAPVLDPNPVPYEASMMFVNFNPSLSVKASDSVYFGMGLNVAYSELELTALSSAGPSLAKAEVDGWGFGANFGLTWLPTEDQRATLTYRSQVNTSYSGDLKVGGVNLGDPSITIKFPNTVGLGYGINLSDDIQVEALLEWIEWSVNEDEDWDDTVTAGVGGSWAATDELVLRAGYAFIPTPISDDSMTWLLPDADRHALSVGLGYAIGDHVIDLAYTFSIYDDRDTPTGDYDIDSDLLGLTYSYSF